ncbi:MAG TPA: hypothetical protein VFR42_06075 [Candidatus Acidoferrum sp.]|nr:hypothetical protein [Candidatus Acidoferrum sp.]
MKDFESSIEFPKPTTPGDLGAASLGLAFGYFGDVLLTHYFPHLGIPPGEASIYTSATVLGAKNIVQSIVKRRKDKLEAERSSPLSRAKKLDEAMAQEVAKKLTDKAQRPESRAKEMVGEYRDSLLETIFLYKEGLITDDMLSAKMSKCISELTRARQLREDANMREAHSDETSPL